jgi:uncharacterized phage protein gp47/JayE
MAAAHGAKAEAAAEAEAVPGVKAAANHHRILTRLFVKVVMHGVG